MALPAIIADDFTGVLKISADTYEQLELTAYITENYERFVRSIIGAEATYTIVNNTITQKWSDLLNGVYYYNTADDSYYETDGILYALKRFIYFDYVRDNFTDTNVGKVRNLNENANNLTGLEVSTVAVSRYNKGVESLNRDVKKFLDNYDNFEGTIDSFVDNGGGSYTINSATTTYLETGDIVTIGGVDYVTSSVVDNTSFNITAASAGLTFTGSYYYRPYESVNFTQFDYIVF